MLIRRNIKYRHTILKSVPKSHLLPFPEYAKKATVNLVNEGMEAFTDEELDEYIEKEFGVDKAEADRRFEQFKEWAAANSKDVGPHDDRYLIMFLR